jgi:hypothetical protein
VETKNGAARHEQHICALAKQQKFDKIKELVADPKHMRSSCGRVSNLGKNLCRPLPFSMIAPGIPLEKKSVLKSPGPANAPAIKKLPAGLP